MAKQTFEIIDGVYRGPEVWDGDLDLRDYKDTLTSLGSLKKIGDWLDLEGCTNLVSLGSLKKIGNWLDINGCTSLTSLGSLKEVMYGLRLSDNKFSPFQKVQENIHYYSSLPLHEALNALHTEEVRDVPLYKNILLKSLQGEGIYSL